MRNLPRFAATAATCTATAPPAGAVSGPATARTGTSGAAVTELPATGDAAAWGGTDTLIRRDQSPENDRNRTAGQFGRKTPPYAHRILACFSC